MVEDDPLIALDLETSLLDLGYEVCACAANSLEANAMGERFKDRTWFTLRVEPERRLDRRLCAPHALYSRYGVLAIIISGSITPFSIDELRATNPLGYIDKPHRLDLIEGSSREVLPATLLWPLRGDASRSRSRGNEAATKPSWRQVSL